MSTIALTLTRALYDDPVNPAGDTQNTTPTKTDDTPTKTTDSTTKTTDTNSELEARLARLEKEHREEVEMWKSKSKLSADEIKQITEEAVTERKKRESELTLAQEQQRSLQEKHKAEINNMKQTLDVWKSRYSNLVIENEITSQAIAAEAVNPAHVLGLLSHNAHLSEVTDENKKGTGRFEVLVRLNLKDEKGQQKEMVLSAAQAVQKMKEDPANGNLFRGKGAGGTGSGGGTAPNNGLALGSMDDYIKSRKAMNWK